MKKLERAKVLVKSLNSLGELMKHGYEYLSAQQLNVAMTSSGLWMNRKEKIVIKSNFIVGKRPPKYIVPTVETECPQGEMLLIQHLCQPHRMSEIDLERDVRYRRMLKLGNGYVDDISARNVMLMGSRLVMVDW